MLSLFDSFVVPGVDYVKIYKDDQDPNLYYMLPEYPSITLASDGGPQFNLIIFGRDFNLFKNLAADLSGTETEGGLIQMTTELSVSDADQAKIRDYIATGQSGGLRAMFIDAGLWRFERYLQTPANPVRLAYPIWIDGKVQFSLIPSAGDTFVKATAGSDKPSLVGTNLAGYQAILGQEGVGLFNDMISKGWTPGMVDYTVTFLARVPNLKVDVTGSMKDSFQNIRDNFCEPYYYGNLLYYRLMLPMNDLQQIRNKVASLQINVVSTDLPAGTDKSVGDDVQQKLTDMALAVVKDFLTNQFFTTFNQLAAQGPAGSSDSSSSGSGAPPTENLFLKNFTQQQTNTIDFHIDYQKNVPITMYPNRALLDIIPADQVKKRIIQADLSHPYFQSLDVTTRVTADYQADPIAGIVVHVRYDQHDDYQGNTQVTLSKDFDFETGQEVGYFHQFMAKDANGTPKEEYTYSADIHYKSASETSTIAPKKSTDRVLIIGYNQLDCIRVQASWGSIPSDVISRVQIHFKYPDPALKLATAEKDISLSPDHPTDSWFTYTGGNPSLEYEYQVSYFLTSGQRIDFPVQKDASSTRVINTPFVDSLSVTFVPQGQFPPTSAIEVSMRYSDTKNNYSQAATLPHPFTSLSDTFTWNVRLLDKTQRAFQYKVDVTNTDGSSDHGTWTDGTEGTILVGAQSRGMMEVDVIPAMLDMQKQWKLVIVKLSYEDAPNNVLQKQVFEISSANAGGPFAWKFPIKDPKQSKYSYEIDAYGYDGVTNKVVGPLQTDNQALVLQI